MTPKPDYERSLGFLVQDLSRLLRRNFNRRLQALGLTQAQWRAILHLSRSEGMTQAALAEMLDVQPITLARLVDRMEAAGWVERRNHPLDRRAVQLYLTEKCEPLLAEIREHASDTLADAVDGLSAAEQRTLIDTLLHIKSNLTAAEVAAAESTDTRTRTNVNGRRNPAKLRRSR